MASAETRKAVENVWGASTFGMCTISAGKNAGTLFGKVREQSESVGKGGKILKKNGISRKVWNKNLEKCGNCVESAEKRKKSVRKMWNGPNILTLAINSFLA